MNMPVILTVAIAASLLAFNANANPSTGTSIQSAEPTAVPALAWRCGKKNPAMWGTIGNGCLKQKRQAKK